MITYIKIRLLFEARDRHNGVESINHVGQLISHPISLSYSDK